MEQPGKTEDCGLGVETWVLVPTWHVGVVSPGLLPLYGEGHVQGGLAPIQLRPRGTPPAPQQGHLKGCGQEGTER